MSGSFLDLLSDLDRSDLLGLGRPRTFRRGASIVVQGDHSDAVLVLLHGLVRVPLDTDDGHEIVLLVLRPDLIGEFEAVDHDGGPRTASNVALEAVDTRVMTGEDFRCYLESHPPAALALLCAIIHRLRVVDQRRIDSESRDTGRRLAQLLAATGRSMNGHGLKSAVSFGGSPVWAAGGHRLIASGLGGEDAR
jgi:CRP/FNR family transcriptional regulator, cyclic AMP receptor protein